MWGIKNGGPAKFGSSPYQARAFKLLKNFDFFRSFLMNECSVDNVELKPVELETSKQFSVQTLSVMSVTNGAYFWLFSLFLWSMFVVRGTVSSKKLLLFLIDHDNVCVTMMTMSGILGCLHIRLNEH